MWLWGLLLLLVVFVGIGCFAFAYLTYDREGARQEREEFEKLWKRTNEPGVFEAALVRREVLSGIAIDEVRRKVAFIDSFGGDGPTSAFVTHRELLSVSLWGDGVVVLEAERQSTRATGLRREMYEGTPSAVHERFEKSHFYPSTPSTPGERIVELMIYLACAEKPIHRETFFWADLDDKAFKHLVREYAPALAEAKKWYHYLAALVIQADTEDSAEEGETLDSVPLVGCADELRKLANLRDEGVLSQEEFQRQKEKLLGGGRSATHS